MKKILSLALALLMMLPLAVGTYAGGVVYTSNPKKDTDDNVVTVSEFEDLLAYWKWINADEDDYDDLLDYLYGSSAVRSWADKCEICGKAAKYYISGGNVYCSCTNCGKTYEIEIPTRNDCDCCDDCTGNYKCECGRWNCDYCEDDIDNTFSGQIKHKYSSCELDDVDFYYANNRIYWDCDNCGAAGSFKSSDIKNWYDWYESYYRYSISVYCSRGGDYSINGTKTVAYGDTRTITFEPDNGYVLYEVTVNGDSYGCTPTLTLEITGKTVVRATFVKESTLKPCTFTTTSVGGGAITAKKNGKAVDADEFTAKYGDTVTFRFTPASSNYVVKNVTVDGVSKGAITSYTITNGITKDHNIKVTFEWKSPYNDVDEKYLDAVEYVTEAGIMGYYNKYVNKNAFGGTKEISVKNLAAALAEMADVNEKLDTVEERVEWAEKNGIVDGNADLTVICDVQSACDIVNDYLALLEKQGNVDFEDFDDDDTAKENAISIGLVTEKTYTGNRSLTRYDLASICYLLVNLDVD